MPSDSADALPGLGPLSLQPLTSEHAGRLTGWRYPAPYGCYDLTEADPEVLAAPDGGFYAVLAGTELVGYRSFGADGQVPGWDYDDSALDTGGGMRPDLTGRGLGGLVIGAGLAFGQAQFGPAAFRVTVARFNHRARSVLTRLGFRPLGSFNATTDGSPYDVLVRPQRP